MNKIVISVLVLFNCLIALLLLTVVSSAEIVESGECGEYGDNVTWTLDEEGTLIISGSGRMKNYSNWFDLENMNPWCGPELNSRNANESNVKRVNKVIIENGVTSIGNRAFYCCYVLTEVEIPESVTDIGDHAFFGCKRLSQLSIPKSVTSIGPSAFCGCGIKNVVLPEGITEICEYVFFECDNLEYITIPEGVTSIGHDTFYGCEALSELVFPSSISKIGKYAFYRCEGLKTIWIPRSITEIGVSAFSSCGNQKRIFYEGTAEQWNDVVNDAKISPNFYDCRFENGLVFNNAKTEIQTVYDTSIENIVIPKTVDRILDPVFYGCTALKNITLEDGNTSFVFENGVLFSADKSTILHYLAVNENEIYTIPAGVSAVAGRAFANNAHLKKIVIPSNVKTLGQQVFRDCVSLETADVAMSSVAVPDNQFIGCEKLSTVIIHDGFRRIGAYAFKNLTGLHTVYIPNSVEKIGKDAFLNCPLEKIYFSGTADEWTGMGVENGNAALNAAKKIFGEQIPPQQTEAGHVLVKTDGKAPTCTDPGNVEFYTCLECGKIFSDPECKKELLTISVPAIGHSLGGWIVTKPPTTEKEGEEKRKCAICGYEESRPVPKLIYNALVGDVSGDGEITAEDARLALRGAVGLETCELGSPEFLAADVDRSGDINAADARLILRRAVGYEDPEFIA